MQKKDIAKGIKCLFCMVRLTNRARKYASKTLSDSKSSVRKKICFAHYLFIVKNRTVML